MSNLVIPKQLQNSLFRFITIRQGTKIPAEKDWQSSGNYEFKDKSFQKSLSFKSAYGVVGGFGNLYIIDFDSVELQEKMIKVLPKTFTVKSGGKGLLHFYYRSKLNVPKSFKITTDVQNRKITLADIQGFGKMVIGPNSSHPESGKPYEVINDVDIAELEFEDLKNLFKDYAISEMGHNTSNDKADELIKCKFHDDSTPSMALYKSSGTFHCFGCGAHGFIKDLNHKGSYKKKETKKGIFYYADPVEKEYAYDELKDQVKELIRDKDVKSATYIMASYLVKNEHLFTLRDGEMWIYRDGIYVPSAESYVNEFVFNITEKSYTKNLANETVTKIQAQTYRDPEDVFSVKNPFLLPVQNGILDLKTKELLPFDSKYIFFNKINAQYNKYEKCKHVPQFIEEVIGKEFTPVIQEMLGYVLLRTYKIPKALLLTGQGRNGKTTLLNIFQHFLGPRNVANVTLQELSDNDFAVGELMGKLACLGGDLNYEDIRRTGIIKRLTGGDMIQCDRKFKSRLQFQNYAKLIYCANKLPNVRDDSEGFYSRWIIIDFPHRFYTDKETIGMEESEKNKVKMADRNLIDKLTTEPEISGLLNWAIEGLHRILENGSFSYTLTTKEIRRMFMQKSNSLKSFVEDKCELDDPEGYISTDEFRKEYELYCKQNNLTIENRVGLGRQIARLEGIIKVRKTINGQYVSAYQGISFKGKKAVLDDFNQTMVEEQKQIWS